LKVRDKAAFASAVLQYRLQGTRTPIAVAWLITGRCTASCLYCRWKNERESDEVDTATALRLIDQMRDAGVRMISFTGGEPLLRRDIGQLIAHVKHRGATCKLNTNGDLVVRRLELLRPLDLLQISLDGPPDVQDRLRGEGSAHRAARAVTLARRAGIPVQVVACLTRDNVERLDEVLDYAATLGVRLHVQPLAPGPMQEDDIERTTPSRERLLGALDHLLSLHTEKHPLARHLGTSPSELRYHRQVVGEEVTGCHCALITATLLPDGRLIFCGNAKDPVAHDAVSLGFAEAFGRLTIPDCDGCTCVGKLRISKVFQLDPEALFDVVFR
jgi:MoaA/NifB/PqqE/SkfB family radical SAM enzyme